MTSIVVNRCYGGFSLSAAGIRRYAELAGFKVYPFRSNYGAGLDSKPVPLGPDEDENGMFVFFCKNPDGTEYFSDRDLPRDDPLLVQVIRELGVRANGQCADLRITEIPDGVDWQVEEYDGNEWVAEKHRTW